MFWLVGIETASLVFYSTRVSLSSVHETVHIYSVWGSKLCQLYFLFSAVLVLPSRTRISHQSMYLNSNKPILATPPRSIVSVFVSVFSSIIFNIIFTPFLEFDNGFCALQLVHVCVHSGTFSIRVSYEGENKGGTQKMKNARMFSKVWSERWEFSERSSIFFKISLFSLKRV